MRHTKIYFIACLCLFCVLDLFAQNDTSITRVNVFTTNISYQSRLHFYGRTDSLKSSGMYPSIGFESKAGFYVSGTPVFINNNSKPLSYTGSVLTGGYKFPGSRNFSGSVFYNHFLYKDNSELVQAALTSQAGINLTYNNKIANVAAGGDLKFSNQVDLGFTLTVDKLIILTNTKGLAFAFNPTASLQASTQKFTRTYYKDYTVGGIPLGQQMVIEKVENFNILAYEFSMPVVVVKGKFNLSVIPSYVIPQNVLYLNNGGVPRETGEKLFYLTTSIGIRL